jgi:hypothetical protein
MAASEPMPIDQLCQVLIALQPRDSFNSISSRYASLAPVVRLAPCLGNVPSGKMPVITSMAAFEMSAPVVTAVAALAGTFRPQPPGLRSGIPADIR